MKTVGIILNYNTGRDAAALAERIRGGGSFDAVILVDNASEDDSAAWITELLHPFVVTEEAVNSSSPAVPLAEKPVYLIRAGKNGGYSCGNNLGLRLAEKLGARYALIANPDTEFRDETAAAMITRMEQDEKLAACAPVCVLEGTDPAARVPGSRENALAGAPAYPLRPWFRDLLASGPVCRRLFTGALFYGEEKYSGKFTEVDVIPGALLMVDVAKIMESGGYDEGVFLYQEEYILASRIRKCGYTTGLLLTETYLHKHPPVQKEELRRNRKAWIARQRLRGESALYYYRKYLGIGGFKSLITKAFYKITELEIRLC